MLVSSLLASTLGRVSTKYRTLGQWADTYRKIIASKPISDKTKANRRSSLTHILATLGDRTISDIKPHEIAAMTNTLYSEHPQCAKRVLIETRDCFNECRSLSERLYRSQGINTMRLLGHKHQAMTDMYNDDRGLSRGEWKTVEL